MRLLVYIFFQFFSLVSSVQALQGTDIWILSHYFGNPITQLYKPQMLYISRAAPKSNFRRRGKRPSYSTPQSILFTFLLLRLWFYVFLVNRLNVFGLQYFNNFLYVPVIVGLFDLIRLFSFVSISKDLKKFPIDSIGRVFSMFNQGFYSWWVLYLIL